MTITLDRKRPFGRIIGDHHGAAFKQNGRYFTNDGEHLPEMDEPAEAVPAPTDTEPLPQDRSDEGPAGPTIPLAPEERIDLKAWARGDLKVRWFTLANAVEAQLSERPRNAEHAREIINAE